MNARKACLIVAMAAPLMLIGATCANPQYALTSMQSIDGYRSAHDLPELEWRWDGTTICQAFLLAGGVGDCHPGRPGLVIPYSCTLTGILSPGSPTSTVPRWSEDRTLPASDCMPGSGCPPPLTPSPGSCLDESLFKRAAIAAYTQENGYIYEMVYLTE